MSDIFDSELFSAYLDGELSAAEQVRVEQMLATRAEARQLVEELRALSGTLQGLPQQKLDEDLSARVLSIAERRLLAPEESNVPGTPSMPDALDKPAAGRAAAALTPPADGPSTSIGFPWREISWRGMLSSRALIWTAIILVVAIILHYQTQQGPKGEVAVADNSKQTATAPTAADADKRRELLPKAAREGATGAKNKSAEEGLAAKVERPRPPADQPKSGVAMITAGTLEADRLRQNEKPAEKALEREISHSVAQEDSAQEHSFDQRKGESAGRPSFKSGPMPSAEPPPMKALAGPARISGTPAHDGEVAAADENLKANHLAFRDGGSQLKDSKTGDEVLARAGESRDGSRASGAAKEAPPADAAAAMAKAPMAAPAPAPGMSFDRAAQELDASDVSAGRGAAVQPFTLVRLNVSAAAAANGDFDKLLASNGLVATPRRSLVVGNIVSGPGENGKNVALNAGTPLAIDGANFKSANLQITNSGASLAGSSVTINGSYSGGTMIQQGNTAAPPSAPQASAVAGQNQQLVLSGGSLSAPQPVNSQQSAAAPSGAASLAGSNTYSMNSAGSIAAKGGAPPNLAYGGGLGVSHAGQANVTINTGANYYQQGPASSASSNLVSNGPGGLSLSTSYEVEVSPAQLSNLLAQVGAQRDAFSLAEVTPPLASLRNKAESVDDVTFGRRSAEGGGRGVRAGRGGRGGAGGRGAMGGMGGGAAGGGGFGGGGGFQGNPQRTEIATPESNLAMDAVAAQSPTDKSRSSSEKPREESVKLQTSGTANTPAASPPALASRSDLAAAKTRVVFVLNVVNGIAVNNIPPPPAMATPVAAPAPPAAAKPAASANR